MIATTRQGRPDALRRLRRSPRIARGIPLPLRLLDLLVIVLSLPIVLPLALVLAVAVFLDSPGPILYRSRRIGKGGRPFAMLKFRTMLRDAEGPSISARGDGRYTPLGRSLAVSRLDELPQLWNVVRGDMRLVGPRPELEEFVQHFPHEYERILSVPPGLTGPAQVAYAWEGETLAHAQEVDRARVYREAILPYKLRIDLAYAERHYVWGDLRLLALTATLPVIRTWRFVMGLLAHEPVGGRTRIAAGAVLLVSVILLAGLLAVETTGSL
jgi:lipopolysaccharide/colanic/teichoic acid biosynthesis glycosyltransferase